jgi:hypothetical protein
LDFDHNDLKNITLPRCELFPLKQSNGIAEPYSISNINGAKIVMWAFYGKKVLFVSWGGDIDCLQGKRR